MTTFDPTKPVQCRDGRKARIVCANKRGERPIVALVASALCDEERCWTFLASGKYNPQEESPSDLINVPEVTKKYQRVFASTSDHHPGLSIDSYDTKEGAKSRASVAENFNYLGVLESTLTDGVVTSVAILPWED